MVSIEIISRPPYLPTIKYYIKAIMEYVDIMIECANTECEYRESCISSGLVSKECCCYINPQDKLIRILEQQDWTVDYSPRRKMYLVSYFQDNHFVDECWFEVYKEKE